jgi:hypothetical protein
MMQKIEGPADMVFFKYLSDVLSFLLKGTHQGWSCQLQRFYRK